MTNIIERLKAVPPWLSLAVIAIITRFVNLGSEALWYDETFTQWVARLDFPHMMKAIAGDVHPPLWYIIEWANIRIFGSTEVALRMPSAVLGVLVVLLVWRLATLAQFEKRTAWLAGLFAATLPAAIYYSQDARFYPLLAFFVLWAAISAIRDNWLFFCIASIGAVYTQNLGAFYVAAIGIATVISKVRVWKQLIKPALAGSATIAAWLAWSPIAAKQVAAVGAGFWMQPLTPGGVLYPLASMTLGWRIPEAFQMHAYIAGFGITGIGLIVCRKWIFTRSGLVVLAVVLGAPTLAAIVSIAWRSVYLPRAFLPSSLALMLFWAYPLRHMSRPNQAVAKAIVIPMLIIALLSHYMPAQGARVDVRKYADLLKKDWQSGDVLYHTAIDSCILLSYYMPPWPYYPYFLLPHASDLNQSLTPETKLAMGFNQLEFEKLKELGYKRVWFIATDTPKTSKEQFDFIDRILATYPNKIVYTIVLPENTAPNQKIYLIDL